MAQETSELSTYEEDKSTRNQRHRRSTNYIMDFKQDNKIKTPKIPSHNSSKLDQNAIEDPPSLIHLNSSDKKGD